MLKWHLSTLEAAGFGGAASARFHSVATNLGSTRLQVLISSYQPGEHVTLKIMRHDKPVTLTAVMPGTAPRDATAYEER